ncbi:unnamed protein product, partial [Ectocarpus sp. 6 AP-2014]
CRAERAVSRAWHSLLSPSVAQESILPLKQVLCRGHHESEACRGDPRGSGALPGAGGVGQPGRLGEEEEGAVLDAAGG